MVAADEYEAYRQRNLTFIRAMLEGVGSRPVLFLGSGISRRYIGGPSWMELLEVVSGRASIRKDRFTFLSQRAGNDPIKLGSLLADEIHEWAWGEGRGNFPEAYYSSEYEKSIFIKKLVVDYLAGLKLRQDEAVSREISTLKSIYPHAIITTNFDSLIESQFDDYELVIGERIIPLSMNITGELYKIHGSVEDPASLILTESDYARFRQKRRYISSKMMTYFAEYPVFIFGYGLGDTNVNSIISDLGEAIMDKGGLLDNVCYVEWVPDVHVLPNLREEYAIPVSDGNLPPLRIRTIVTSDLSWILEALADLASPVPVNIKVLRQLAARVVQLVRADVPQNKVEVDYQHIEKLTDDPSELAMVLGISNVSNANLQYPYILSQVGRLLGYRGWHGAQKLLLVANERLGIDIKSNDNEYHLGVKTGQRSVTHKFSERFVNLLKETREAIKSDVAGKQLINELLEEAQGL